MSVSLSSAAILTEPLHLVFIGIGSNNNPIENIRSGLIQLRKLDEQLVVSKTYQSKAVGFEGPHFLNLVVRMQTPMAIPELTKILKKIELTHGREPHLKKYSSRTLDIDVLTFDDLHGIHDGMVLPRPEILVNAYVLQPFAELAPNMLLSGSSTTMATLWEAFDRNSQPLVEMPVCW